MGSKSGYSSVILRVLGLIPGQRAERYLWCEPDPGVRLLLEAYRDAGLAREAATIIRSWAAEDPRALWERLRAEGPPRLPDEGAEAGEVARWVVSGQWSYRRGQPDSGFAESRTDSGTGEGHGDSADMIAARLEVPTGDLPATVTPDARDVDPREVARWAFVQRVSGRGAAWGATCDLNGNGGCDPRTGQRFPFNLTKNTIPIDEHGTLPATVTPDARDVDPREVARWMSTQAWTNGGRYMGPDRPSARREVEPDRTLAITAAGLSSRADTLPTLPAAITPDAREVDPGPCLPPGTVAYMDPPYVGTTGYASDLPRADVVALAQRWAAAGATVCISEAEPIPELVAEGWWKVRIDGERVGQKRTFSKQQAEWLTLNRAPAWVPSVQQGLFG
jgi:hypothetical protein